MKDPLASRLHLIRGQWAALRAVVLTILPVALIPCFAQTSTATPPPPQRFALADASSLAVSGGKAEPAEYLGRKAVRLTTTTESDIFAYVNGTDMQDGAVDVDIAVHITTPPGVRMPGFTGIAFRARPDASHYDMFYLRPRNALAEDQAMRNHSVQYVAKPGFDWEPLRRRWPFVYESWADLKPDAWTHVRIEIHGRVARLFLNGSDKPSLVVNELKGEDLKGGIALWGYPGEESYFANLRVTPKTPLPLCNCGEPAGSWHVKFGTDNGPFEGEMNLQRQGSVISGTWSAAPGESRPVTGTWRNGYVELTFTDDWKDEHPGTSAARLAGWIDGDAGTGRVVIDGRADGQWMAERKK
jgi:hypothetical protein